MRNPIILPIKLSMFALAVAACTAESTNETARPGEESAASGAQPAAADPCSYVSKEDVTAAAGETILQVKADGGTCRYETDDAMASSVQVEIKATGGAEEMEIARSAAGALGEIGEDLGSEGAQGDAGKLLTESGSAPAIGDQAFFGPNHQLHVLKGDAYFAVSPPQMKSRMSGGNPLLPAEKKRAIATAVAEKIARKL